MASPESVAADRPSRDQRRDSRLDARYLLWDLSSLERVKACGRYAAKDRAGSDTVKVMASGSVADGSRVAGLGNVQSCGSVWSCPVCSEKVQARRQTEVSAALAVARLRGWEVLFLTLTMRHSKDHRLGLLWNHLTRAWGAITTGKGQRDWARDKRDFGIAGYLRLVEVTHGYDNGWHVHCHVLLFCDPAQAAVLNDLQAVAEGQTHRFADRDVTELGTRMFMRWRGALNYRGIRPSLRRGVDIRRITSDDKIAEYFAKQLYHFKGEASAAHDVTGSHGKTAKHGNRTPFGILADVFAGVNTTTGELRDNGRDLDLWRTYEKASKGRRQLLWSRGLRQELGLDVEEKTDQELVDEALGGEQIAEVPAGLFKQITRRRLIGDLLRAAELDDTGAALRAWLAAGLDWYNPNRLNE